MPGESTEPRISVEIASCRAGYITVIRASKRAHLAFMYVPLLAFICSEVSQIPSSSGPGSSNGCCNVNIAGQMSRDACVRSHEPEHHGPLFERINLVDHSHRRQSWVILLRPRLGELTVADYCIPSYHTPTEISQLHILIQR